MIHKWWHKFVRRHTRPIAEDSAFLWKRRLSIAYGLFAWNAVGFVMYNMYKGKADWAHYHGLKTDDELSVPPALGWAHTLGIKNAKVYRISGFQKVDEYDIIEGESVKKNDIVSDNEELPKE